MTHMKKLTLTFALLLVAAGAAQAPDTTPVATPSPSGSSSIYPKKITDPVIRDEALIAESRTRTYPAEREALARRYNMSPTFKAVVEVLNHSATPINTVE